MTMTMTTTTQRQAEAKGLPAIGDTDREASSATPLEKALCAVPYILPLSDGVIYAQHIYSTFPRQMEWSEPLAVSERCLGFLSFFLSVVAFVLRWQAAPACVREPRFPALSRS